MDNNSNNEYQLIDPDDPVIRSKIGAFIDDNDAIPNCITSGEFCKLRDGRIGRILQLEVCQQSRKMLFLFQLYKERCSLDGNIHGHFAIIDRDLQPAVKGLQEVVRTNLAFWVEGDHLIERLVFPVHSSSAKAYVYGPLESRKCDYFWRYDVIYEEDDQPTAQLQLANVPPQYRDFGPEAFHHAETFSERIMFGLRDTMESSNKLLWRAGKMHSRTTSEKRPKLMEQHRWETNELIRVSEVDDDLTFTSNKRMRYQKISQGLSAKTVQYKSIITKTTANTPDGYKTMRRVYGYGFGTGVKTKFPKTTDVNNRDRNPKQLTKDSIVNGVDLQYGGDVQLDHNVNAGLFERTRQNSIAFEYDPIKKVCHMKIQATPMSIAIATAPIRQYLSNQNIDHDNLRRLDNEGTNAVSVEGLAVGTIVVFNNTRWRVIRIDSEENVTIAKHREETTTHVVTADYCKANTLS